jgi:hypothetical protein
MKKLVVIVLLLLFAGISAFGQVSVGTPDATDIGVDSAQQKLKEVSVDKFERAGSWLASMPRDMGLTTIRRFTGGPIEKEPLEDEVTIGIDGGDVNVVGVKVQFFKRGLAFFNIYPIKPLPVEGITKTVSVWVVGRNTNHILKIILEDQFGHTAHLTMGKLNFSGWKKLTVAIPPTLVQRDFRYTNKLGIKIAGFRIECDPTATYGSYYIYFDDLRATTDLFAEESRDEDDMPDGW